MLKLRLHALQFCIVFQIKHLVSKILFKSFINKSINILKN